MYVNAGDVYKGDGSNSKVSNRCRSFHHQALFSGVNLSVVAPPALPFSRLPTTTPDLLNSVFHETSYYFPPPCFEPSASALLHSSVAFRFSAEPWDEPRSLSAHLIRPCSSSFLLVGDLLKIIPDLAVFSPRSIAHILFKEFVNIVAFVFLLLGVHMRSLLRWRWLR